MPIAKLEIGPSPAQALTDLKAASSSAPAIAFKFSPICPVSTRAEREVQQWVEALKESAIRMVTIDVIAERELARGLTAEIGIQHESPQLLWYEGGELVWHGSHADITEDKLNDLLGAI
ncbi:MAG: bacillithiol system protein YtxJ [Planctomycetota bacterium]|jgi:bacillithiol system protein YtxJ